jgi:hypothetical protein
MTDSTSILDLPTDPVGGGSISNNITIQATENISQMQNAQQNSGLIGGASGGANGITLDQTSISQLVSGLQQAIVTGATKLPSRDIPINTNGISNDPYVQPNYVPLPPQPHEDYIKNYEDTSDMVDNYNKNARVQSSLDEMYNEIQTPLLLAVLYFLFQLPFFRKFLYRYLPFLFSNDGNLNLNGFLFTSILFGIIFHASNKIMGYLNTF